MITIRTEAHNRATISGIGAEERDLETQGFDVEVGGAKGILLSLEFGNAVWKLSAVRAGAFPFSVKPWGTAGILVTVLHVPDDVHVLVVGHGPSAVTLLDTAMPEMTAGQRALFTSLADGGGRRVRGAELRVARALAKLGFVELEDTGVAHAVSAPPTPEQLFVAEAHADLLRGIYNGGGHSLLSTPGVKPLMDAKLVRTDGQDAMSIAELTPLGRRALWILVAKKSPRLEGRRPRAPR